MTSYMESRIFNTPVTPLMARRLWREMFIETVFGGEFAASLIFAHGESDKCGYPAVAVYVRCNGKQDVLVMDATLIHHIYRQGGQARAIQFVRSEIQAVKEMMTEAAA